MCAVTFESDAAAAIRLCCGVSSLLMPCSPVTRPCLYHVTARSPTFPRMSSASPSSASVYSSQQVYPRVSQHPSQMARPVSVCPVDPAPPMRPTGICRLQSDAAVPGVRSCCWTAQRLVSWAARTARSTKGYVTRYRGRGRRLGERARGCRGLVGRSCVM
jgi:hypothetical protein